MIVMVAMCIVTTLGSLPCQIVFGFFNDSFTGVEQGSGHMMKAGYQKGAAQAGLNLVFNVMDRPATASEFTLNCFCLGNI